MESRLKTASHPPGADSLVEGDMFTCEITKEEAQSSQGQRVGAMFCTATLSSQPGAVGAGWGSSEDLKREMLLGAGARKRKRVQAGFPWRWHGVQPGAAP